MDASRENRTAGELFRELSQEATHLVRQEIELAKTEMMEKVSIFGRNAMYVAIGAAVAYAGFLILLAFAVAGLGAAFHLGVAAMTAIWLSALIVGAVVAAVGVWMTLKAVHTMKHESLVPRQTVETLREGKEWVQKEVA